MFICESGGRYYALAGHTLASARGQGEPAAGQLILHLVLCLPRSSWEVMSKKCLWEPMLAMALLLPLEGCSLKTRLENWLAYLLGLEYYRPKWCQILIP